MSDPIIDVIRQRKRISKQYRKSLETLTNRFIGKMDNISRQFDADAQKITKINERKLKVLLKDYDRQFNSIHLVKNKVLLPSLRKRVKEEICEYYGITVEQLMIPSRGETNISECRQIIYYFMLFHNLGTVNDIGKELGRNHSSVLKGIKPVEDQLDTDPVFKQNFNNVREIIQDLMDESVNKAEKVKIDKL